MYRDYIEIEIEEDGYLLISTYLYYMFEIITTGNGLVRYNELIDLSNTAVIFLIPSDEDNDQESVHYFRK